VEARVPPNALKRIPERLALRPEHRREIVEGSGVGPELAAKHFFSVTATQARALGFAEKQAGDGWAVEFKSPTNEVSYQQITTLACSTINKYYALHVYLRGLFLRRALSPPDRLRERSGPREMENPQDPRYGPGGERHASWCARPLHTSGHLWRERGVGP
jgi:hypothetical protein